MKTITTKTIILTLLTSFHLQAAVTISSTPNAVIPNNSCINVALGNNSADGGITDTIFFLENGVISDVNVEVDIIHSSRQDLRIQLAYGGVEVLLVDSDGEPNAENYFAIFDDDDMEVCVDFSRCGDRLKCDRPDRRRSCYPWEDLNAFNGMPANTGVWTLSVCDQDNFDQSDGVLERWSITIDGTEQLPIELSNFEVE